MALPVLFFCSSCGDSRAERAAGEWAKERAPSTAAPEAPASPRPRKDRSAPGPRQRFLDGVAGYARAVADGKPAPACPEPPAARAAWPVAVTIHHRGQPVGHGQAEDPELCAALRAATERAAHSPDGARVAGSHIEIALAGGALSVIEHGGTGAELTHGVVAVRSLTANDIRARIDEGARYLARVARTGPGPGRGGVHKYYRATEDRFEPRVHAIYTASTIYTLVGLERQLARTREAAQAEGADDAQAAARPAENAARPAEDAARLAEDAARLAEDAARLAELADRIAASSRFLLTMQNRDEPGVRGAFHYALDLERNAAERRFVVGTTAKSIFTLLALHQRGPIATAAGSPSPAAPRQFLDAAILAGDWLMTMQNPDGSVTSYVRYANGKWRRGRKRSMLYTGQVLSALSRLYAVTRDPRYRDAAASTAAYLAGVVRDAGCYVGDDYRKPNPISSSWVILSMLDYHRATGDRAADELVRRCGDELLARQIDNPGDAYRHGRWRRSLSSSGNGWLAEVYALLHAHCRERGLPGCARWRDAVVRSIRLIAQYTYTPHAAYVTKNAERARGGVFWNANQRYVRTDAVCHAMNAYLEMLPHLGDGELLALPTPPLAEQLAEPSAPSPPAAPAKR